MAEHPNPTLGIGHPAPLRDRVSGTAMGSSLLAGPMLWLVQLLTGFAFSSYLCFPNMPRLPDASAPSWIGPLLTAINLLALAATALSIVEALGLLRRTRSEHEDKPGGLIDAGEGRTRFLAVWALFIAGLFLVAIAFNTIFLILVPTCPV